MPFLSRLTLPEWEMSREMRIAWLTVLEDIQRHHQVGLDQGVLDPPSSIIQLDPFLKKNPSNGSGGSP